MKFKSKHNARLYESSILRRNKKGVNVAVFECKCCLKLFRSAIRMKIHMKLHGIGKQLPAFYVIRDYLSKADEVELECKLCGKWVLGHDSLEVHLKTHIRKKLRPCDRCGSWFVDSPALLSYLRILCGEELFECKICNKKFEKSIKLTEHLKDHIHRSKPYECTMCSQQFMRLSNIIGHLRVHKEFNAVECKLCNRCSNPRNSSSSSINSVRRKVFSLSDHAESLRDQVRNGKLIECAYCYDYYRVRYCMRNPAAHIIKCIVAEDRPRKRN